MNTHFSFIHNTVLLERIHTVDKIIIIILTIIRIIIIIIVSLLVVAVVLLIAEVVVVKRAPKLKHETIMTW